MSQWIKIAERQPAYDEHVLLRTADGSILQGFRTTRGYVTRFSQYAFNAKHWMLLPPPPQDAETPATNSADAA